MHAFFDLYAAHPFWVWLALGAVLLALEAASGSGWLLWPAASAGVIAVLALTRFAPDATTQIGGFALLTLLTTVLARRWLVRAPAGVRDINDPSLRLVGQTGEVTRTIIQGRGRVFVGGAEWPADLEAGGDLDTGSRVVVVAISGARLTVKAA